MSQFKIRFWKGDNTGCGHYRCELPAEVFRTHGADADASISFKDDWAQADVVVGQRITMPGPSRLWKRTESVFRVYELDDDIWNLPPGNPAAYFFGDPDVQQLARYNIAVADRVIVSTEALAARVFEEYPHPDIRVVPNLIPERYIGVPTMPEKFTVGWSGSPTHRTDWLTAVHGVRRFLRRNPDTELHLIADVPEGLRTTPLRFTSWVKDIEEHVKLLDFHVGLAPLRPNTFNQSKSALKALEYAARGIPILASNTGPYPNFVADGKTGFLVKHDYEWEKYLRFLRAHPMEREALSLNAWQQAAEHTIEKHAESIMEAYKS